MVHAVPTAPEWPFVPGADAGLFGGEREQEGVSTVPSDPAAAPLWRKAAPAVVVALVWLAMTVSVFLFVHRYGVNVPYFDEWQDTVPHLLTDAKPLTLDWLFSFHNEHRIPLPRLFLLSTLTFSGGDLRAGMFLNAGMLALLAALLIVAANRMRGGRSHLADAAFPILLLHPGHYANLLWAFQIQFVLSCFLSCIALLTAMTTDWGRDRLPKKRIALLGICLLLLPLCGANGTAFVPPLALWLAYAGFTASRKDRSGATLAWGCAAAGLLVAALTFIGMKRLYTADPTPIQTVMLSLQYLSTAVGRGLLPSPAIGDPVPLWLLLAGAAISAALVVAVAMLGKERRAPIAIGLSAVFAVLTLAAFALRGGAALSERSAQEAIAFTVVPIFVLLPLVAASFAPWRRGTANDRLASLAVLAFVAGVLLLMVGTARGRAGISDHAGLAPRYTTLTVALPIAACLAFARFAPDALGNRIGQMVILSLSLICLPGNIRVGDEGGTMRRTLLTQFTTDASAGTPASALTAAYVPDVFSFASVLAEGITELKSAKVAPYTSVGDEPQTHELHLHLATATLDSATQAADRITPTADGGSATWRLPAPRFVYAVRVKWRSDTPVVPETDMGYAAVAAAPGELVPLAPRTDGSIVRGPNGRVDPIHRLIGTATGGEVVPVAEGSMIFFPNREVQTIALVAGPPVEGTPAPGHGTPAESALPTGPLTIEDVTLFTTDP